MRPVLGSFISSSSGKSLSMRPPPTIPSIELFNSSHTKSSNKPIDGKTMRGVKKLSPNTESHIASAYNPHLQPVLSVDAVPIKCNELESIRRLLDELDVYLGEDGWSKRAGEAAKNMELLTKIDLFILQRLKAKLDKSIQRVQMLLAKLTPMQLFDLEL